MLFVNLIILVANPCDARDNFSKIIYIYFKHATKVLLHLKYNQTLKEI